MSVNNYRKCAKCSKTRIDDMTVTYHRFPYPGKTNVRKAKAWANYCWPDEDWSSVESLLPLYNKNRVLCSRHFSSIQFLDNMRQKLSRFAIPGSTDCGEVLEVNVLDQMENQSSLGQTKARLSLSEINDNSISSSPLPQIDDNLVLRLSLPQVDDNSDSRLPLSQIDDNSVSRSLLPQKDNNAVSRLPLSQIDDNSVLRLPVPQVDDNSVLTLPMPQIDDNSVLRLPMPQKDDSVSRLPLSEIDDNSVPSTSANQFEVMETTDIPQNLIYNVQKSYEHKSCNKKLDRKRSNLIKLREMTPREVKLYKLIKNEMREIVTLRKKLKSRTERLGRYLKIFKNCVK